MEVRLENMRLGNMRVRLKNVKTRLRNIKVKFKYVKAQKSFLKLTKQDIYSYNYPNLAIIKSKIVIKQNINSYITHGSKIINMRNTLSNKKALAKPGGT